MITILKIAVPVCNRFNRFMFLTLLLTAQLLLFGNSWALNVPITISEAKPNDIGGIARTGDLASFGIPLADSDGINSVSQLGLTGSSDYQFRTLSTHLSGNLKWVLVDTLVSTNAGAFHSVTLTDGNGNSTGAELATDHSKDGISNINYITVETGAATFVIKKAGFRFLDAVIIGGDTLVNYDTSKGIVINDGTTEYTSAADNSSMTMIEENGPVKCCIKSTGVMKNGENTYLAYTARLYFVKGQAYCRALVSVRNASNDTVKIKKPISEFGVQVKMNATEDISYILARQNTDVTGTAPGYLYQGYVGFFTGGECDKTSDNYSQIVGDSALNVNGTFYTGEYTRGYAQVSNHGYFVNMGMTAMFNYWPAGFEVSANGTLAVNTYSRRNSVDASLAWGQWQTREIIFEFSSRNSDPLLTLYRIQYPLMGRANLSQYNASGGLNGATDLVSVEAENDWISTHEATVNQNFATYFSDYEFSRKRSWNCPGGFQNDPHEVDIINWVRTGNGVLFNRLKEEVRLRMDDSIIHTDGFSYKINPPAISDNTNTYVTRFDWAHRYWECVPIMYYLSGNESIKDSIVDLAEWVDFDTSATQYRTQNVVSGDMRVYSRNTKALLLLAEILGTEYYKNIALSLAKMYVKAPVWNLDRGFALLFHDSQYPAALGSFFVSRIHADTVYQFNRVVMGVLGNFDIAEDLSDRALGWAYFMMNELATENSKSEYDYETEARNDMVSNYYCEPAWFHSNAYDKTADVSFFNRRSGIWSVSQYNRAGDPRVYGERGIQGFISRDLARNSPTVGYVNPVAPGRVDMASGISRTGSDCTLTFLGPAGATSYQIKVSDKPMVENLGFNQFTRVYTYDPSIYDNFWAATNLRNEPTPTPGQTETVTVNLSTLFSDYNTLYGLNPGHFLYKTYDPAAEYYFAVKYLSRQSQSLEPPTGLTVIR